MADSPNLNDEPTVPMRSLEALGNRARSVIRAALPVRILVVILLLLLAAAALIPAVIAAQQPRPLYATARLGDVIRSLSVNGAVSATTYHADFPVDGTLSEIDVTVGQQVRKGDTLARLDVAPFESALTAAQSNDSSAQQSLGAAQNAQDQAQVAVDSASSSLDMQQGNAQTQCAVQPADPDACAAAQSAAAQAQAQMDASQAQLAAAQARVATAQASEATTQSKVAIAQAQLGSATLSAPHDGVITAINGALGGKPGATANGVGSFITISDTGEPLVTALIGYHDIGAVHAGQAATFRVTQASASALFTGLVTGVSPIGQGAGSDLKYPVSLKIDPASLSGARPLPGMTADTRIITSARYHVVVISNDAIAYARQAAPSNGSGMLTRKQIATALASARATAAAVTASGFDVVDDPITPGYLVGFERGHYVAIPVVLGLSDGRQTEVVAGLTTGQQVVSGQRSLFFG